MWALLFLLCSLGASVHGCETPAAASLPTKASFTAPYSKEEAMEDLFIHVQSFAMNNFKEFNNIEKCENPNPHTEKTWRQICEKALGLAQNQEGVIYLSCLDYVLRAAVSELGFSHELTNQIFWLKRCLNKIRQNNLTVDEFIRGVNWKFYCVESVLKRINKDICASWLSARQGKLEPFSSNEWLCAGLLVKHGKVAATAQINYLACMNMAARIGEAHALVDLGTLIQSGLLKNGAGQVINEKMEIVRNHDHEAARLFRSALEKGENPQTCVMLTQLIHTGKIDTDENGNKIRKEKECEVAARLMRRAIQHGRVPQSYNSLAVYVDERGVQHDEMGKLIPDSMKNVVTARLYRKACVGSCEAFNSLALHILLGKTNCDEYGESIPQEQKYQKAAELMRRSIDLGSGWGAFNYAKSVQRGEFQRDEKGSPITNKAEVSRRLFLLAQERGMKHAWHDLAGQVWNKEVSVDGSGAPITDENRSRAVLDMFSHAEDDLSITNKAVFQAQNCSAHEDKNALYKKLRRDLERLPETSDTKYSMAIVSCSLKQSDALERIAGAIAMGVEAAYSLLWQYHKDQDAQLLLEQQTKAAEASADSSAQVPAIECSDEDDFPSEDEDMAVLVPQGKPEQPVLQAKASPHLLKPKGETKANVIRRLDKHVAELRTRFVRWDDKRKKVDITWSDLARNQLPELLAGEKRGRLPLLIEAAKEIHYSRKLIQEPYQAVDGNLIYYGNLNKVDRLEFTRKVENGRVVGVHILTLKGHHTANIGKRSPK